jgi:hypothetical protein
MQSGDAAWRASDDAGAPSPLLQPLQDSHPHVHRSVTAFFGLAGAQPLPGLVLAATPTTGEVCEVQVRGARGFGFGF